MDEMVNVSEKSLVSYSADFTVLFLRRSLQKKVLTDIESLHIHRRCPHLEGRQVKSE